MLIKLDDRALLKVSGPDSENFLQSQFSNDIKNIKDNHIQINAYCQHQGKIIAIIWVFKKLDSYYLSLPLDLKDVVLSKLNMYKMMSNLEIDDFSFKVNQYGLIGEIRDNSIKITDDLSLLTTRKTLLHCDDAAVWEFACINAKLAEINLTLSENFIPQALNLDIDLRGVSFSKGCYPGQEVVARMHYLGKPKRRLFIFNSNTKVIVGDKLNVDNSCSLRSSGQVIRATKRDNLYYFLATFEVNQVQNKVFLNGEKDKLVKIIDEQKYLS